MADPRMVALQALIRKEAERKKKRDATKQQQQQGGETRHPGAAGAATHDGKAAQRIVMATVDEVLGSNRGQRKQRVIPDADMAVINEVPDFLGRKNHPHQDSIPMLSQWRNVKKSHSTLKKKQIVEFCRRMTGNAPNYVCMRLGCEEIDDNFARMIADAVRKNTYGRELLLYGNRITDEGVRLLVDALRFHPLERLSLGGNLLSDDAARRLSDLCFQNQRIRFLNVANRWPQKRWSDRPEDPLHPIITQGGARCFADRLLHNGCGLVALYLSDQRIGDDGAAALFSALQHNSRLQVLCLDRNGLTDACCGALKELLLSWEVDKGPPPSGADDEPLLLGSSLDDVSVAASAATGGDDVLSLPLIVHDVGATGTDGGRDGGAQAIPTVKSAPLSRSSRNRKSSTKSGKEAEEAAAAGVAAGSCKLQLLTLAGNAIGDTGAVHVARGLASPRCQLRILSLEANAIGDDGLGALAKCLHSNKSLRLLVLRGNPYHGAPTHPAAAAVDSVLRARRERAGDYSSWDNDELHTLFAAYVDAVDAGGSIDVDWDGPGTGGTESSLDGSAASADAAPRAAWMAAGAGAGTNTMAMAMARHGPPLSPIARPYTGAGGVEADSLASSLSLGTGGSSEKGALGLLGPARPTPGSLASGSSATATATATTTTTTSNGGSSTTTAETSTCRALLSAARTPLFPTTPYSADMGKTIGLPSFGHANEGSMPIRTLTSRFIDSKQHLMNLRVSRKEDPPDSRPVSVIKVGADRRDTILQVKAERQTAEYKYEKLDRLTSERRNQRQRAAIKPPPDKFWKQWQDQMLIRYPRGIDQAAGVKSTAFDYGKPVVDYDGHYLAQLRTGEKVVKRMVLLKSPAEAFANHRMEKMVKNELKAKLSAAAVEDVVREADVDRYARYAEVQVTKAFAPKGHPHADKKGKKKAAAKDSKVSFV